MSGDTPPRRPSPYRLSSPKDEPCLMLFPSDPAAGPAYDAYATTLWRLYQREEIPSHCQNRDELLALIALVSALRQRAEEHLERKMRVALAD